MENYQPQYLYNTPQKPQIIYLLGTTPKNTQFSLFEGGPGSGKGTQCARLVRDFNYKHISVGDIMRNEMKNETEIGKECEGYVRNGGMVPSKLTVGLILKTLQEVKKTNKKILLDGFPRNLEQGILLEQQFEEIDFILNFNCDEELLFQRLMKRKRIDDNEETIRKRIEDFNNQTQEALQYYSNFGKVVNINGDGTVEEVYERVLQAILPNVIFFYGAPGLAKSTLAEKLANRMFYKYINLEKFYEEFLCTTNEDKVNMLMQYLRDSAERNFIIDDFFCNTQQISVFFSHFGKPRKIFYFDATKDQVKQMNNNCFQVDSNIYNYLAPNNRNAAKKKYEIFTKTRKEILSKLQPTQLLTTINYSENINDLQEQILKTLKPQILIAYSNDNHELYEKCLQYLIPTYQFTELDFKSQLLKELDRNTPLGKQISTFTSSNLDLDLPTSLQLLRKIIFHNPEQHRFIITGFCETITECQVFENECCGIDFAVSVVLDGQKLQYGSLVERSVESWMREDGRHFVVDKEEFQVFDQYLEPRSKFGFILGAPSSGKTTLCKELEQIFNFQLIDFDKISTMLKEKLGGQDGPLDELSFAQLTTYFKQLIKDSPRWQTTLFDGFPFEMKELQDLINELGEPNFVVYLNLSKESATAAYRRKNELEQGAELGEDDLERLETFAKPAENQKALFHELAQKSFYLNYYEVNGNNKLHRMSVDLQRIFYKRVIACDLNITGLKSQKCWENYSNLLCNVCTKLQIGFVDVRQLIKKELEGNLYGFREQLEGQLKMRWTDTPAEFPSNYSPQLIIQIVKRYFNKFIEFDRDVLLLGFPSGDNYTERGSEEQFFPRILDETTLIEEQIGPIKIAFLITDSFQQSQYDDPVQEIMKIEIPEKKQKIIGEDGEEIEEEEKQEEEEDEDGEKKKKFNPAEFSWTVSDGIPKNFSQILHKKYEFCDEEITLEENALDIFENVIAKYLNNLNEGAQENYFVQFLNCFQN